MILWWILAILAIWYFDQLHLSGGFWFYVIFGF